MIEQWLETIDLELIIDYGGSALLAALILIFGFWFASRVDRLIRSRSQRSRRVDETLAGFFGSLARYAVLTIVFITVPVFAPVVVEMAPELGLDPSWAAVWFGILFVMNIQIYFLSPPFGPACFWLKSVAPADITLQEIFAAVLPFIAIQIVGLMIVMFFPDVALFLPKLLS